MMKRTIVLLLLTFLCVCLPACGNRPEDVQAKFLELIGEPAAAEHLSEVVEYMDETVPSLDIKTASSIVAAYEDYLYEYTKNGTEQTQRTVNYLKRIKADMIYSSPLLSPITDEN